MCKVVELQMQFYLPKFFGATPPETSPKWGPKNQFFERLKLEFDFFFEVGG